MSSKRHKAWHLDRQHTFTALDTDVYEVQKHISKLKCVDLMKYCSFDRQWRDQKLYASLLILRNIFVFSADRGCRHYKPVPVWLESHTNTLDCEISLQYCYVHFAFLLQIFRNTVPQMDPVLSGVSWMSELSFSALCSVKHMLAALWLRLTPQPVVLSAFLILHLKFGHVTPF